MCVSMITFCQFAFEMENSVKCVRELLKLILMCIITNCMFLLIK